MNALVVVLRNIGQIDKLFSYEIPKSIEHLVKVGSRVMVPFGPREKIEGIVFDIVAPMENEGFSLKPITYVFEDGVTLSQTLISHAIAIKEMYLCTYSEALQLFLPSGVITQSKKVFYITDLGRDVLEKDPDSLKEHLRLLLMAMRDKACYELELPDVAGKANALKKLTAMAYITWEYTYESAVKDRYEDWLIASEHLADEVKGIPKGHAAKLKLATIMLEKQCAKRKDIRDAYKIAKSVVDGLVKNGLLRLEKRESLRLPEFMNAEQQRASLPLMPQQKHVFEQVLQRFDKGDEGTFLLHGVTGSGKTEVYASWIETMIQRGKKSILLVPEIALTPQIVSRFCSKFGKERIALIHSKISAGEKYDQWKKIKNGDYDLIIGARSAVFAPCDDLGLIIVDECHESSYRSEKRPKYNALEVASLRAQKEGALLIYGSATPTVASYYEALKHPHRLVTLDERWKGQKLPQIEIVDMRKELASGNVSIFSERLFGALEVRLQRTEQSIILLNRKGHSTFVSCRSCGFALTCPHCDVTLTYFKGERSVRCNYCDYKTFVPKKCPKCDSTYFKFFGTGTEKVEEQLRTYFPHATIARMDRTTTSRKGTLEKIISDVENEHVDILIGTQMVAKGLDFKNVTLIGILSADLMLNLPSYMASERAYQLFQQVAGRSGRGDLEGEVILQAYNPDHYAIQAPNYEQFYNIEMDFRKNLNYPPFSKVVHIVFLSTDALIAKDFAEKSYKYLSNRMFKNGLQNDVEIFRPNPALLSKIDGEHRWQILIKVRPEAHERLKPFLKALDDRFLKEKKCRLSIDLDAVHIL